VKKLEQDELGNDMGHKIDEARTKFKV